LTSIVTIQKIQTDPLRDFDSAGTDSSLFGSGSV